MILMKRFFFIFSIFVSLIISVQAQNPESDEILRMRKLREEQFRTRSVSPLTAADFADFRGLEYFAVSDKFRVKAVFSESAEKKIFSFRTSTNSVHKYMKIGDLKFEIGGAEFIVSAYQRYFEGYKLPDYAKDLFVPFKDETNGKTTYSGGRYLFLRMPQDGTTIIDFNAAINPSCAYGDSSFSCPIPPKENFLKTEIKAGEKIYKNHGKTAVD